MAKIYKGKTPPCGVYCGDCPHYTREKNPCPGADIRCAERRCKSFFTCCVEKKGLDYCFECHSYPCRRFKQFNDTWKKYGQDLMANQELLKNEGEKGLKSSYEAPPV